MKKILPIIILILVFAGDASPSYAAWIWSPDIGKWINPKKSAKDTPEEQFAWALSFYEQKNWDRAIEEFEKLPEVFPTSKLAAEGVYYLGLSWEAKGDPAKATDDYQKLIDRYPYSDRIKDAVKREFAIADDFANGGKIKVLNVPILPGQEKAVEIYKHIIKNAPYGTYGDQAQFKIGEVYKAQGEYEEAQKAYQQVVDEYPSSPLVPQARYQIAYVSMQASKKATYDERYAERAIEEFQGFKENYPTEKQAVEADEAIKALREKKALTNFTTAEFYEKQKKFKSAKVYYEEVVTKYPETASAEKAKKRVEEIVKSESEPQRPAKPWFKIW